MSWVKVDDQFFRHPKVLAAGRDARDLYLVGLTYCAQSLTDGFIPGAAMRVLAAEAEIETGPASAARLIAVGLWEVVEGGYVVTTAIPWARGHDPVNQEERNTGEYRAWRRDVLMRDGFQCRRCGAVDDLHAHHILGFAEYPSFRTEITNGETLCGRCHRLAHANDGGR